MYIRRYVCVCIRLSLSLPRSCSFKVHACMEGGVDGWILDDLEKKES